MQRMELYVEMTSYCFIDWVYLLLLKDTYSFLITCVTSDVQLLFLIVWFYWWSLGYMNFITFKCKNGYWRILQTKWAIAIWKIKFFTYYFIMGGSKTRAQNLSMQWYHVEVLTMSSKVLNCCGEYINIDLLCLSTVMLSCSGSDKS